ncbi:MAG: glycosyltransferase family 4 protein [Pseudomonadota bacterium]
MRGRAMHILHISADFPDPLVPAKTRAVASLLELVAEHAHTVYSLNSVKFARGVHALPFGPEGEWRALSFGAWPKGLWLTASLAMVAEAILEDVAARGLRPDAVHAHKLSMEGLVGETVAARLGVPLIVSSQGNTDTKIIAVRRDLVPRWARIWHGAAAVLPFAPWTEAWLSARLGAREGPVYLLPCPTPADGITPPRAAAEPLVVTAFNLAFYGNKNALALMEAASRTARALPGLTLEIIGGGDAAAFHRLSEAATGAGPARVRLPGPAAHGTIQARFNAAGAFALASHRESFGLVFVEALLAGCPIVHTAGMGFDGYLEDGEVSLRVPSRDTGAIAEAMTRILREEAGFKARLAALQESGGLARFRRDAIADTYRAALAAALPAGPSVQAG